MKQPCNECARILQAYQSARTDVFVLDSNLLVALHARDKHDIRECAAELALAQVHQKSVRVLFSKHQSLKHQTTA